MLRTRFAGLLLVSAVSLHCHAAPLVFEAEAAELLEAPVVRVDAATSTAGVVPVPGASGGSYMAIPQGVGNPPAVTTGKAVFTVVVPESGNYTLWLRAYWDDSCGNSVGVQVNDTAQFMVEDSTYKTWHWVRSPPRLQQLTLTAGRVQLTIQNREDGVRIDQVLLTTDRRYVPVDIETPTPQPAAP